MAKPEILNIQLYWCEEDGYVARTPDKLIAVWGETPLQALQAFGKELQPLLECSGLIAMAQDQNPNE